MRTDMFPPLSLARAPFVSIPEAWLLQLGLVPRLATPWHASCERAWGKRLSETADWYRNG